MLLADFQLVRDNAGLFLLEMSTVLLMCPSHSVLCAQGLQHGSACESATVPHLEGAEHEYIGGMYRFFFLIFEGIVARVV